MTTRTGGTLGRHTSLGTLLLGTLGTGLSTPHSIGERIRGTTAVGMILGTTADTLGDGTILGAMADGTVVGTTLGTMILGATAVGTAAGMAAGMAAGVILMEGIISSATMDSGRETAEYTLPDFQPLAHIQETG